MKKFLSILLFALVGANAHAYCYAPSDPGDPPDPPSSYSKPSVPYCLTSYSYSSEHTCDEWEIRRYFSDVEDYQRKLKRYARELEDYLNEVTSYVESASKYAVCEYSDIASQHE